LEADKNAVSWGSRAPLVDEKGAKDFGVRGSGPPEWVIGVSKGTEKSEQKTGRP